MTLLHVVSYTYVLRNEILCSHIRYRRTLFRGLHLDTGEVLRASPSKMSIQSGITFQVFVAYSLLFHSDKCDSVKHE
jgi:hypothetical protein